MKRALKWLLSAPELSRDSALERMERISACTHLMSSAEHLARPDFRRPGGLNDWEITRGSSAFRSPAMRRVLDVVGRPEVTSGLHVVRVVAAAATILPGGGRRRRLAGNATLATTSALLHPRHHYGTDGSDQVSFLVQSAAAIARAGRSPALVDASLWAVGLQGTLSYAVSGWAKLAGPTWRQGRAIEGVTRTMTYGDEWSWKLVRRHPTAARLVGASVLALECAAPLVYLGRGRLARSYSLGVTSMHLGIAKTMALGRFVPSFLSMHPPMLYTARPRSATAGDTGGPRSDVLPRMVAVAAAAVAAKAVLARRATRATVLAGQGGEQTLSTGDGNRLRYRRGGSVGAPGPVYLFENALLATPEHWAWITGEIGRDAEVVTYDRAGYGASTVAAGTAMLLDDLVGHARAVIDRIADGRPVVLVGHSLGGFIALRAAAETKHEILGVVLVDSSHPEELTRSTRQGAGADSLTQSFPLIARSLDLGCGMLLEVPDWVRSLPEGARRTALAQYRDSRLWRAGQREWDATLRDFRGGAGLPRIHVPVLCLSAEKTVVQDAVQHEMHAEMVGEVPGGRHEIVDGANHDSILTQKRYAHDVAGRIRDFAAAVSSSAAPTAGAGPVSDPVAS